MSALERTEALKPGDVCQWRHPARQEWHAGTVVVNGGSGYWTVEDDGEQIAGLYIELVSAPGERWYDPT